MHIIVPMSGTGKRFIQAGYDLPKPLIEVDGKPIIEHIINLFPGEPKFTFIINELHDQTTPMRSILNKICPTGKIRVIESHHYGPVYAVTKIFDQIDDEEEAIVNYCDFGTFWDYHDFLKHTRSRNADGALPAYKGFHPHMLGDTHYAFIREEKQWMQEIKEKDPFTLNRMEEYASNGTYYFKHGRYIKKYFPLLMDKNINVRGEFYVSLIFNLLAQENLKVSVYEIQHMLQWGTPEDLHEYQNWSNVFRRLEKKTETKVNLKSPNLNLIPLAGRGERFSQEGYSNPKPLIQVSGRPMIIQAANFLPVSDQFHFVCLKEHLDKSPLEQELKKNYSGAKILTVDQVTRGQASTCEIGLQGVDWDCPLHIGACDNGMLWDLNSYQSLLDDPEVDIIVWTFKNHPSANRRPQMYGWLKTGEDNKVFGVSVKKPISNNHQQDQAIVGTFFFKKAKYFFDGLKQLYQNENLVNGEFYVDSCIDEMIKLGIKVKYFQIDYYICWGTPNDLKTFEYWQSFFHKCPWHPYKMEKDKMLNQLSLAELEERYAPLEQKGN